MTQTDRTSAQAPIDSEAALEHAFYERARLDDWREVNTHFQFWRTCPTRACRRHRRCSGDPARCHAIFWPVVPEPMKVWWAELQKARHAGHSARRAFDAAQQALAAAQRRAKALRALGK